MSLRELYQEMIVDHGKQPRNFGLLPEATHCEMGYNPLCGDKITLYLVTNNGVIESVRFEGVGCAISVASASLMTESIKGKSLGEVETLFQAFHALLTEGAERDDAVLGKLAIFAGVAEFPIRVKCATLAWHTLKAALSK
ncbi:MAG TPA: SUF system NifU family Fe-S cluster assembly protein [Gammaproteobacteria bacterium]|jgi:nitrogen fixation NifU-like protein|nr:SUF system NifU family Fe-S cluster assembly protein [Gammaproteobacteria bacterium]